MLENKLDIDAVTGLQAQRRGGNLLLHSIKSSCNTPNGAIGAPIMGARTSGRQAALQMLFGIEATGDNADHAIRWFWREFEGDPEGREYADSLIRGIMSNREKVDQLIRDASTNWRLERMTRVDRNLLRLATYELLASQHIPRAVILDEAVELAKSFGAEESGAFVNGVLDRVAEDLGRFDADRL